MNDLSKRISQHLNEDKDKDPMSEYVQTLRFIADRKEKIKYLREQMSMGAGTSDQENELSMLEKEDMSKMFKYNK